MNRFLQLHENPDPKIQIALRYASSIMAATFVTLLLEGYLAIRTGAWQLWCTTSTILLVFVATYISRQLILAGKTERAAQVLIYSVLIAILATPFFIAGVAIVISLGGAILTVEFASRTVERPERHIVASLIIGTITILLDLYLPDYRLTVPALQLFIPIIAAVALLVAGFMTVRGFQDYKLRTKLIIVIITIVMVSVGTIAFLTNRSLSTNLTTNIGSNMSALANSKAVEIRGVFSREVSLLKALSLTGTVQNAVDADSSREVLSVAEIQQLDSEWIDASKDNNLNDTLVMRVLHNSAASQLRSFQKQFPQHVEIFLTNPQGLLLAATNITSDYYQADEEWWQIAYRERLYIGQPEYDESSKTTAIIIAMAIREEKSRNVLGILRTTVKFDSIVPSLATSVAGKTSQTVVYLPNHQEMSIQRGEDGTTSLKFEKSGFDINVLSELKSNYFEITYYETPVLASQAKVEFPGDVSEDSMAISKLHWRVIVFQDRTEALQPVQVQTRNLVFLAFIILIAATFAALGLAQLISGPLIRLNAIAEQVATGDLSAEAGVETGDETGTLAKTFNSMTAQLRDLIGTLEHHVAERTKALATSAEVSRHLSTILNERQLVVEVVERLKAAFDYYHVHIYLTDESTGDLVMAGGTGDVGASLLGSGHKVPKGKGLVGRAAQNNVPVLVSDTSQDPDWLPNPLLPETKSEAAVPIATAGKVLGVLDVQHNNVDGLQQEDVDLLQSIANQVAVALLNARAYVDIQQRAEREARVTSIGLKIKSTTSIEAALQATARELGRTLGANDIRVILEAPTLAQDSQEPE